MSISDFFENTILDHMLDAQAYTPASVVWAALNVDDPLETGACEVSGQGYVRQTISWNSATGGLLDNDTAIEFTDMPAACIRFATIHDASLSGSVLWSGSLSASKTVNASDTFQFPAGSLDVTLD